MLPPPPTLLPCQHPFVRSALTAVAPKASSLGPSSPTHIVLRNVQNTEPNPFAVVLHFSELKTKFEAMFGF